MSLRQQRLGAFVAEEDGQRDAPVALARDAPVGAVGDHGGDALFAPGGEPLHALDGLQGLAPQIGGVHGDEPLLGGAVDDRVLAAPAVGIGVLDGVAVQQAAAAGAGLRRCARWPRTPQARRRARCCRRNGRRRPPANRCRAWADAGAVVVLAVAGRRVHAARALVEQDVVGVDQQRRPVEEGVAGLAGRRNSAPLNSASFS